VMLVKGKDYIALVDTGTPDKIERLITALKQADVEPGQVSHVIITHAHFDHTGGLLRGDKALFPNAKIVICEKEYDFWIDNENQAKAPEATRGSFVAFQKAMAAYRERIEKLPLNKETEYLPGLVLIPAFGHTPGHLTVLADTKKKIFFWGDLLHAMKLQLEHPHISPVFDLDSDKAAGVRKELLQRAKKEGWQTTGVHVPGPFTWSLTAETKE